MCVSHVDDFMCMTSINDDSAAHFFLPKITAQLTRSLIQSQVTPTFYLDFNTVRLRGRWYVLADVNGRDDEL